MKTEIAYIIPGYGQSHKVQKGYAKIAQLFEEQGIIPIHVNIDWSPETKTSFSNFVQQFLREYKKAPRGARIYVLGFSYGATTAFLSAIKVKPKALMLCSLSPYFVEDLKNLKPAWVKSWYERFVNSDYTFSELAPRVKVPVHLIVGNKEDHSCMVRARDAKRTLPISTLTIAKGAKHDIGQKPYLHAIERAIKKLERN